MFLYPSTITDADWDPPSPEQLIEYVLFPGLVTLTSAEPDVAVEDVQDAEHDEELVDDHVKVTELFTKIDPILDEIFTLGNGGADPPPPPPPPHDAKNKTENRYKKRTLNSYI